MAITCIDKLEICKHDKLYARIYYRQDGMMSNKRLKWHVWKKEKKLKNIMRGKQPKTIGIKYKHILTYINPWKYSIFLKNDIVILKYHLSGWNW